MRKKKSSDLRKPATRSQEQPRVFRATLSVPWAIDGQHRIMASDPHAFEESVRQRTSVHKMYIRNQIIKQILAFTLIVVTAIVLMFAPPGREIASYWTGAALLIFAAGAFGFHKLWGKIMNISFGADKDSRKR